MSPMLTEMGLSASREVYFGGESGGGGLVAVVLSRMEAVLLRAFATAKSGFPSPLKSPMLTDSGDCQ
jgi:hypothetical protein